MHGGTRGSFICLLVSVNTHTHTHTHTYILAHTFSTHLSLSSLVRWQCFWGTVLANANFCRHEWDKEYISFFSVHKVCFGDSLNKTMSLTSENIASPLSLPRPLWLSCQMSAPRNLSDTVGICSALRLKTLGTLFPSATCGCARVAPGKGFVVVGFWWFITLAYKHTVPVFVFFFPEETPERVMCQLVMFILLHIFCELHNTREKAQLTRTSRPKWLLRYRFAICAWHSGWFSRSLCISKTALINSYPLHIYITAYLTGCLQTSKTAFIYWLKYVMLIN